MRALCLVLLAVLGCERAVTEPVPAPTPPPPGPTKIVEVVDAAPEPDALTRTTRIDELAEIYNILNPDRGGTYDPKRLADPNRKLDPSWDPRRVWLTEIKQDGRAFAIRGAGIDAADTVQFMKRLAASVAFTDVTPTNGERIRDNRGVHYTFRVELQAPGADPGKIQILDQSNWKRP